jgi:hypothetical protein
VSSARFVNEVRGQRACDSVTTVCRVNVHALDLADSWSKRPERDTTGHGTFATRNPEPTTRRLVRRR